MNVTTHDVFQFPEGEEANQIEGLQDVQQRMKDVIMVLSDFKYVFFYFNFEFKFNCYSFFKDA